MTYRGISAIPTHYAGVNFRSRLEARWAAFFDLLGWKWEYEPFDYGGWIPDFRVFGKRVNCLIEVKPIDFSRVDLGLGDYEIKRLAKEQAQKAFDSVVETIIPSHYTSPFGDEVIICGLSPFSWHGSDNGFGYIVYETCRNCWSDCHGDIGDVAHFCVTNECPIVDYQATYGAWEGRISGIDRMRDPPNGEILGLWREAGNIVQWNARP